MKYERAPEIKRQVDVLIDRFGFHHIVAKNIHCIRSFDAKTRAYARIWGMAKLFKEVVGLEPNYIIEVNARRFDKLPEREKIKTLVHELMHIPKTFSGSLLSHRGPHHRINDREVEKIIRNLEEKNYL
ncbi:metallopeptidase [Candidatus Roizmanbacteria bacterium]|nr:metallopeptidase [Candidatus Roizmanbacteria bacterium]